MGGRSFARTDPGLVRNRNEDAVWVDDSMGLYVVADGVGSQAAGDLASRVAIEAVRSAAPNLARLQKLAERDGDEAARRAVFDALAATFEAANREIFERTREDESLRGIMSTLTVALVGRAAACVAHVGDSRMYLVRDGHMDQITVDHTLAEELVQAGRVSREQLASFRFRNVLSRALGERATVAADLLYVDLRDGDTLLLCSDGITDFVAEIDILRALLLGSIDPATTLVDLANDHGGADNIAAVVVQVAVVAEPQTHVTLAPAIAHTAKLDLLASLDFCAHLSNEERMKVLRYVHEVDFASGVTIVRQGDQGQDFFLVVDGALEVLVDEQRVHALGAGSSFGEIALVSGAPRSATVRTTTSARLFRLSRDGFYDLSQKDQAIAVKILWSIAQSLATRVTDLSREVVDLRVEVKRRN
jgi:serine/threonine protein phosphatase PrpC/CRP-like cAMP-binding protein